MTTATSTPCAAARSAAGCCGSRGPAGIGLGGHDHERDGAAAAPELEQRLDRPVRPSRDDDDLACPRDRRRRRAQGAIDPRALDRLDRRERVERQLPVVPCARGSAHPRSPAPSRRGRPAGSTARAPGPGLPPRGRPRRSSTARPALPRRRDPGRGRSPDRRAGRRRAPSPSAGHAGRCSASEPPAAARRARSRGRRGSRSRSGAGAASAPLRHHARRAPRRWTSASGCAAGSARSPPRRPAARRARGRADRSARRRVARADGVREEGSRRR